MPVVIKVSYIYILNPREKLIWRDSINGKISGKVDVS